MERSRSDLVRYIVIGGSLIACFINLIDELSSGAPLGRIMLYSGVLLLTVIVLIFVEHKFTLPLILIVGGFIVLIDHVGLGIMSVEMILFGYGMYLLQNKYVNYIVYLITAIIVVTSSILDTGSSDNLINTLLGYSVFFALNEIVYGRRHGDVSNGG